MESIIRFWFNLAIGIALLGGGNGLVELTKHMGEKAAKAHKSGFYSVSNYNSKLTSTSK